ncbi:lysophospholipid acyltransferase family protein [Aeromicrobium sp. IC_218]|uniref:lysophospholipid acyltransferase family protein n=1 Tax=Aeromicrobium sp. IC_218 TaxID=2545468 RepID=UPI00103D0218|nr:lysophospholipid acyltransferase family protein [Aeromicrobium sp. IC_218]TCI97611.1 1-acyl-sn-glycerol-3-phosphate acyltransferase [Aeromicrobium sp. IC_218]
MTDSGEKTYSAPGHAGLTVLRATVGRWLGSRYDLHQHGTEHVPADGPVIFAANHSGWLDGPLLIACTPRPAHALVKAEQFEGRSGALLRLAGQISVRRDENDAAAVRKAVAALEAQHAVAVFPEGTRGAGDVAHVKDGMAYLALVTGAPVVPVAIFGTRQAGQPGDAKPDKGARIELFYGRPIAVERRPWPRARGEVRTLAGRLQQELRVHVEKSAEVSEVALPGPLPPGDTHV